MKTVSGVPHLAGAGQGPEEACSRARMTAAALKRSSADCVAALSAAAKGSSHSAGGQKGLRTSLSYSSLSSLGAHSASILLAVLLSTPAVLVLRIAHSGGVCLTAKLPVQGPPGLPLVQLLQQLGRPFRQHPSGSFAVDPCRIKSTGQVVALVHDGDSTGVRGGEET